MQLFVLYRSPRVPLQPLMAMLSRMLIYASTTDVPTMILGDFNDILSQPNCRIVNTMSNHGYSQLVTNPTTHQGVLIDHVYYNRHTSDIVHDTYYSDHNTIDCSVLS